MSSVVWGVGLLAEAIIRVPLVFLVPVEIMVGSRQPCDRRVVILLAWNSGTSPAPSGARRRPGIAPVRATEH